MIFSFEDFCRIDEGVEAVIPLSSVIKLIAPFGWEYIRGDGGDGFKFKKGMHMVYGHLKHGNSKDSNRKVDVSTLDTLRTFIINDFYNDGDLSLINEIPWDKWGLPSPFKRELKDYDPETGKKIEKHAELNMGQKLNNARKQKDIAVANEKYKDADLVKIDPKDENSGYIMTIVNDKGWLKYNSCRSLDDRRPIHKEWFAQQNYKIDKGKHYFGKDNLVRYDTRFYEVLPDGKLDSKEMISLRESKIY